MGACDADTAQIYALIDPRDGTERYVGRTIVDLGVRLSGHLTEARPKSDVYSRKVAWLRDLIAAGLRPKVRLLEDTPIRDLGAEQRWILRLSRAGAPLTNEKLPRNRT